MKSSLIIFLLFYCAAVFGQISESEKIDLSAAKAYINVATQIQSGVSADSIKWSQLFNSLPCQMMIQGGAMDTTTFKSDMLKVYNSRNLENGSLQNERLSYHYEYKKML